MIIFIISYVAKFAFWMNMISEHKYLERIIIAPKQHDTLWAEPKNFEASGWDNLTSLYVNYITEWCLVLPCCDIQFKVESLTSVWTWCILGQIST